MRIYKLIGDMSEVDVSIGGEVSIERGVSIGDVIVGRYVHAVDVSVGADINGKGGVIAGKCTNV